jgi:hypothetical protein
MIRRPSGNDSLGTPFDDDSSSFNPSQTDSTNVEAKKAGFIKSLFKKRYGVDFEVFEFLIDRYSKMDLKSVTLPVVGVVPVFKPGDHEKLDAYMGMGANHHDDPPADFDSTSGFDFYDDAEGHLKPDAQFSTTNFVAYRNSVQMTKLVMLMESPAFDSVAGAGAARGQLSALFSNILTELNGVPTTYDFSLLNLNGAHGGNIFTATLPGVAGTDGRPWLESIDADSVWRTDSHTTTSILFRVSYNDTALSPAEYQATVDSTKQYKVYATWQSNVTQKTDNVVNSNFPDQRITLDDDDDNVDDNAIYRILDGASPGAQLALVKKDQRLFATDFEHEGLAYSQLGTSSTDLPVFKRHCALRAKQPDADGQAQCDRRANHPGGRGDRYGDCHPKRSRFGYARLQPRQWLHGQLRLLDGSRLYNWSRQQSTVGERASAARLPGTFR